MQYRVHSIARFALAALAASGLAVSAAACAQTAAPEKPAYKPTVGQEGKDVIWVPTPDALVERMLQMAKTTSDDYVIDLGSGDGRTVIAAAKNFGARSLGIEYNPDMVDLARRNAEKAGVAGRAEFVHGDIFKNDFSQATVLTLYLLPHLNHKLRPTILNMKPGTRVVSHAFNMDDWQPDQTTSVEGRTAYFWVVPAKVEGKWGWGKERPYELKLRQHFQMLEGLVTADGKTARFRDGKLTGDRVSFSVIEFAGLGTVRREYSGRVNGDTIEGIVKLPDGAGEEKWTATRAPPPAPSAQKSGQ
jgi:SAM-dependent methyltransferase